MDRNFKQERWGNINTDKVDIVAKIQPVRAINATTATRRVMNPDVSMLFGTLPSFLASSIFFGVGSSVFSKSSAMMTSA